MKPTCLLTQRLLIGEKDDECIFGYYRRDSQEVL
jgi:hypothetical protein